MVDRSTNSTSFPIYLDDATITALAAAIAAAPPTGGATSAKQDTGNTSLAAILAKIIAAPATEAKQDTGNTSLASLVTNSALNPIGVAYTDRSIANLAGTSESLMGANAARRILVVHNISATSIAINLTGGTASLTVAGSVVLVAGGSLVLDRAPPVGAITIIGTTNADVTAHEG